MLTAGTGSRQRAPTSCSPERLAALEIGLGPAEAHIAQDAFVQRMAGVEQHREAPSPVCFDADGCDVPYFLIVGRGCHGAALG